MAAFALTAGVIAAVVAATLGGTASARNASGAQLASSTKKCGKTVTIGFAYPQTGAASIGVQQLDWAKWAVKVWNKSKSNKPHIALQPGDTALGAQVDQSVQVAQAFSSNGKVMAVSGPPGSQQVEDSISAYKSGGLAPVSGSATRIALTRGLTNPSTPRETPKGYFYRTVPNDALQGGTDATYIAKVLKKKNVRIIDDGESYSQGLEAAVKADLQKAGVTVTTDSTNQQNPNYQSLITAIPGNTQLIFIPWQLSSMAQTFFTDLRANGKNQIVFGSDGTWDPTTFVGVGSYVSGFPVDPKSKVINAFMKAHHKKAELFGVPSYTSVLVNANAIKMACKAGKGKTSRKAIRKDIAKVKLSKSASLLGFPVRFLTRNSGKYQGPGDLAGVKVKFGIYKIEKGGIYKPVG
jgi:ABC-type branched-subunit amino acid transport system substrate-binding protein